MTDAEFEVEAVLRARGGKGGKQQYLVRWAGYGAEHDSWEPAKEIQSACPDLCSEFEKAPTPKPPKTTPQKRAAGVQATPAKKPKTVVPPPAEPAAVQPSAAAASPAVGGKSEYELERERTIQRNLEMLRQLGLLDAKGSLDSVCRKPTTARAPRKHQPAHTGPRRTSNRKPGAKAEDGETEDANEEEWRPTYSSRTFYYSDGRDYGHDRTEAEWNLPIARDAKGNALQRRRSCHICTQCVASWRGAFSTPLGCSSCPLLWCSRCLTNIFGVTGDEEGFNIEAVIRATNAKADWKCFKCRGMCACQAPELKRLTPIDRHKKWGWVGVTGARDASCTQPVHRAPGEAQVDVSAIAAGAAST